MTESRAAIGEDVSARPARPAGARTIIIFSYHYPPAPEVGGLRARKLAASFAARGDRVHVIAGPYPDGDSDDGDPVTVHRIDPSLDVRGLYRRLRRGRAAQSEVRAGDDDAANWRPPERTSFIKRQISSAMWLPDDHQGWILPAARFARTIASRHGVDLLYSTAPPFSGHLAGLMAARSTRARWVAEFRDPWTGNLWKPDFVRSAWSDAMERWLERRCLRRADLVVTVTEDLGRMLRDRLPRRERDTVLVIRNGIDQLSPRRPAPAKVRSMAYVGTLYQNRDPRPFLRALAAARSSGLADPELRVDFIGACRWYLGQSVEDVVAGLGLHDVVRFTDTLPHAECMARIRSCDVLLLFAQKQPQQVPNKLYEYLGVRRPILAFADAGGETARMLERLGGHHIVDRDDTDLIERTVAAVLQGAAPAVRPDAEAVLRDWTAERQLERLHDELRRRFE